MLQAFRSLTPMTEVTQYVNLWERLWNDEYVAAYRAMTGWATDHVPFPGAAAKQTVQMLLRDNALMTGRLVLGGGQVSLAGITVPFLSVLGISWAGLATVHTAGVWGATSARRRRPSMACGPGSTASVPSMPSR
jgi:hypothetical protein